MRIVKNIEEPTAKFDDLMIGDVFLDGDENVCIKVPMVYKEFSEMETENLLKGCVSADDLYEHLVNAYDLEHNEFFWLDDDDKIRPLNARMEVK